LWDTDDGLPGAPEQVLGIPVAGILASRPDAPGALVALQDRRLALTGVVAAIGHHRVLRHYVRGRARTKADAKYRAWLANVAAVLEQMQPESRSG
jgi:hypothetical protein